MYHQIWYNFKGLEKEFFFLQKQSKYLLSFRLILSKNCSGYFLANFEERLGYFLFQYLITLVMRYLVSLLNQKSVVTKRSRFV